MCQDWPSGVPGTTFSPPRLRLWTKPFIPTQENISHLLECFQAAGMLSQVELQQGPWGCVYPSKLNSSRVQTPIILAVKLLALAQLILRRGSGACTAPSAAFSVGSFTMRKIVDNSRASEKNNRAKRGLEHSFYGERLREWDGSVWRTGRRLRGDLIAMYNSLEGGWSEVGVGDSNRIRGDDGLRLPHLRY